MQTRSCLKNQENLIFSASRYYLLFMLISFFACIMEVVYCAMPDGIIYDCGFLTMPVCPIYGTCILALYFLLGTPNETRGILKNVHSRFARYSLYAVFAFIIPTAAEFVIAFIFDKAFSLRLWDYSGYPMHLYGYICIPISLTWAVLIPVFMRLVFAPLKKLFFRISRKAVLAVAFTLLALMALDFAVNLWLMASGKNLLAAYLFGVYQ